MKNTVEKISAFGFDVYKFNIQRDGPPIQENWIDSAIHELEREDVKQNQSCNLDKGTTSQETVVWSTFETPGKSFFEFKDSEKLMFWIKSKIKDISADLGFSNVQSIELTIDWMNVMHKGSFGNCHTHDDDSELDSNQKVVAIFYLSAPKNSSDLLVLKNTRKYCERGISPFSIPIEEIFPIKVNTGDLIIHKVDLPHAVGRHEDEEPRLCLVMEFRIQ